MRQKRPKLTPAPNRQKGKKRADEPEIRRFPYRSKRDDIPLCGAKTRKGSHCRNLAMPNGRCRMHGGQSLCGKKHPNYKHGSYCKDRPPSSQERVVGPSLDEILARIVVEDAIDPSQQNSLRQAFEEAGQTFTPKQKRFVAEYFKDLNATRAYIRAGYAPKAARVEGHRLLKNPKISSVLQRVMKLRSRRTEHVQDRVVEGLAEIAFQKITDYVTWDDQGVVLKEFSPRRLAAISSTETKGPHSRIVRVRLHDKMKALKLLGRHLGLF